MSHKCSINRSQVGHRPSQSSQAFPASVSETEMDTCQVANLQLRVWPISHKQTPIQAESSLANVLWFLNPAGTK